MKRTRLIFILTILLLATTWVAAQQTGGVTIRVMDEQGALPGATVTLSNDEGKIATTTQITNKNGEVKFPVLMAGGGYSVDVAFPGKTSQRRPFDVKVRQNPVIIITLADEFVETVEVTAQTDVVDIDKTDTSTNFNEEFIDDLPVAGRLYQNILTLAPGVQDPDGDGNPVVHGSRSRDFKTSVGGIANVDPLTGQQLANVNPNSIEEMEVITAGAGPEYQGAQGGYANIIQKQGSNNHEGNFDFLFRSSTLDGDGAVNRPSRLAPDFTSLQPSIQFTGPLMKDKLWYRLSHEYQDFERPLDAVISLNTVKTTQEINSDQVTWQVSDKNKLAFKYDANPTDVENAGVSAFRPVESAFNRSFDNQLFSIQWQAPYSPTLFLDTVVGYQDSGLSVSPTTRDLGNDCVTGAPIFEEAICQNFETGTISGSFNQDYRDDRQRFTVNSTGTYFKKNEFLGMEHSFRFGFNVANERFAQEREIRPFVNFFVFTPLGDGDEGGQESPEPLGILNAILTIPRTYDAKATGNTWGFYFRDDMKPRSNMTISWGFSVNRETRDAPGFEPLNPQAEFDNYAALLQLYQDQGFSLTGAQQRARNEAFTIYEGLEQFKLNLARELALTDAQALELFGPITVQSAFQFKKRRAQDIKLENVNFAPYLAFNWDPWNNNKTRIGITMGRQYNNLPLNIPMSEQGAIQTSLNGTANKVGDTFVINGIGNRSKINPAASVNTVSRDLRTPYQDEFTATLERELWSESSMRIQYINRSYEDQLQDIDINSIPGDFGTCVTPSAPGQPAIDFSTKDGIIDDCIGKFVLPDVGPGEEPDPFNPNGRIEVPDGVPDLYKLNPFWGPIYELGNYNSSDYESFVLEYNRRLYRGWQMTGSYTWSISRGNGEDWRQAIGDDQSLVDDEFGFQSTDQRHVVKISATTVTPWGFRLGGSASWQSGLPFSLQNRVTAYDTTIPELGNFGTSENRVRVTYPTGVRNDQRNPSWWNFDIKATKDIRIGNKVNGQISLDVYNLLNEGYVSVYNPFLEYGRQVNGNNEQVREFGRQFQIKTTFSF